MSGTVTIGKVRLVDEYISDQIDSIEHEQIAVSGRVTAVEQTIATLDSTALSNRVTTAEQEIEALEEEDVVLAVATSVLSNRVTTAEQDIDALEAKDVALESATTALSNRVTSTESSLAGVLTNLASVLARIAVIEANYYDTRGTCVIRNHVNNKLLSSDGNLYPDDGHVNFHYSIEKH